MAAVLIYGGIILAGLCVATVAAVIVQCLPPWDGEL